MELVYLTLIALSIYALFDVISDSLRENEVEELKKRINELEKRVKND